MLGKKLVKMERQEKTREKQQRTGKRKNYRRNVRRMGQRKQIGGSKGPLR